MDFRHQETAERLHNGWIVVAALIGVSSVAAGAFAAHGLNPVADAARIGWLRTGSLYAALHALALLATFALAAQGRLAQGWARGALWLFSAGAVLFPGALYGLALGGPRWLGAIAPFGGTALILGWLSLAGAALRTGARRQS